MAGDITRITFNVLNFLNSERIEALSNEELGQWMRLWAKSILLGKECTLPDDRILLAKYAETTVKKLSDLVLEHFPIVKTEFGLRRRNTVLYSEWVRVCGKSEEARESAERRWKARQAVTGEQLSEESTNRSCERIATALPTQYERNANRTEQNRTKENRTEHGAPTQPSGIGEALDELNAERNPTTENNGRSHGTPGFYRPGQYPGVSPKAVWKHCADAWSRLRGDGAICRYPTKHRLATTDTWADLCVTKPGDLIVPAFELWIDREGKHLDTQYPLSEFLKGSIVQKYLAQISPLNEVRPRISTDDIAKTYAIAKAQHAKTWGLNETEAVSTEPGAEAFLED